MFLNFRQGIVSGSGFITNSGSGLGISGSSTQLTTVTAAYGDQNLIFSFDRNYTGAFNLNTPPSTFRWLYVELLRTGGYSFGNTDIEPTVSDVAPVTPSSGEIWFSTVTNKTYVFNVTSNVFEERIVVLLATVDTSGNISYYPAGQSQVSISSPSAIYQAGEIVFDEFGTAILKSDGTFLTTTSDLLTSYGTNLAGNLEATVISAIAGENIADHKIVRFSEYTAGIPKVVVAEYDDVGTSLIGYVVSGGLVGSVLRVILQGTIVNTSWTWETDNIDIGAKLYLGPDNEAGDLLGYDPHDLNPARPKQVPVAKVLTDTSVYFCQGLGGIGKTGPKGPKGDSGDPATTDTIGAVRLSKTSSTPTAPVVVETTDPRLFDARAPLGHTHFGSEVFVESFSTFSEMDVQDWIELLALTKLNTTGGTMTGPLILDYTPSDDSHAVSLGYVNDYIDTRVNDVAVPIAGGTMTGLLVLSGDPTVDLGAATKQYVDTAIAGVSAPEASVKTLVKEISIGALATTTQTQIIDLSLDSVVPPVSLLMYFGNFTEATSNEFTITIEDDNLSEVLYEYHVVSGNYKEVLPVTLPTTGNLSVSVTAGANDVDTTCELKFLVLDTYVYVAPVDPLYLLRNDAGIASSYQLATINGNDFSYITPASVPATNRIGVDIGYTTNLPMWTDKRAIEFQITRFDAGNLTYTGILDPGFYPNAYSQIFVNDSQWTFFADDVATVSSPVAGSGLQTVGIVIDGTTGDTEFYLDGVLVGTSTSTLPTSTNVMFTLYWNGDAAVTGEGIEGSVRTLGTDYQYTYGVGVKDLQGNAL